MTKRSKVSIALTAIASVGVIFTAVMAAKESKKYKDNIASAEWEKDSEMSDEEFNDLVRQQACPVDEVEYLTKWEKTVIFAKSYKWSLLLGAVTEGCLIGGQVLSIKEVLELTGVCAAIAYKFEDAKNYIKKNHPEQYEGMMKYVNENAAKRNTINIEETPAGFERYYFPNSDQIVDMKPEDLMKAQGFLIANISQYGFCPLNDVLDYIHQDLGYKDVHLCHLDYVYELPEDFKKDVKKNFPILDVSEFDDIYDEARVVKTSIMPTYKSSNRYF